MTTENSTTARIRRALRRLDAWTLTAFNPTAYNPRRPADAR